MVSYMDDTSGSAQYTFDVNKSPLFRKDSQNYINILGKKQLNTLENVSLLDIFLSTNNVVEPHYHQNAAELVYCISGAVVVSLFNPVTKKILNFPITCGQVVNIPQGWWHYIVATADNTHILGIFDAPNPEVVLGSDILHFTPANIMSHTYCLNKKQWENVTAPIRPSTFIGPYKDCHKEKKNIGKQYLNQQYQQPQQNQEMPYYPYYQQYRDQ